MEIKISGRNMTISPKLQSYVERKVDRLDRYLPDIREVRVDLAEEKKSKSPDQHIAQITLRHQRGTILRAEERTGDIFAAVDGVVDKLYRQIEKYKGRRRKKGENVDQFSAIETAVELPAEDFETGKIIRRKTFSAVPMHEEEAIEQMELLGHDFFVFVSGASGNVNVLYRRNDGNLGILVPEVQ